MIDSNNPIQPLTKIVVARAQLVTALDLFVRDKDPNSIQCLACGGGEVIEALASQCGGSAKKNGTKLSPQHSQPEASRRKSRRLTLVQRRLNWRLL